ncbi:hypothetical protein KCU85_g2070, partial [Aureobasidium melanogenum]
MSQARSNLGYLNTYDGGMVYNGPVDKKTPQNGQTVYTQPWSQMPVGATAPLAAPQWSGQYYRHYEGWYEPEMLSSSDMTSETSGLDHSATPSLHRSDSGNFSEVWDQEPPIPVRDARPAINTALAMVAPSISEESIPESSGKT